MSDDRAERFGLMHRDVGKNLAIQCDSGEIQGVDELTIGEAFRANCSVNALDPKCAEAPLLHLPVAIGILAGLFDRLPCDPDGILAAAIIALRRIEKLLCLAWLVTPRLTRAMTGSP